MRRTVDDAAQTRLTLLRTALDVFAERGYAAATLAAIAERAGLTRGAVYHHFEDKAELYLAAIAEGWGQGAGAIWAHLDDAERTPAERLRAFLVAFFTALEHDGVMRSAFWLSMQGGEFPELRSGLEDKRRVMDAWASQLAKLLTPGRKRSSAQATAGAIAIIAAVNGAAATWLACPDLFSPARQAEALADAILLGALPRR